MNEEWKDIKGYEGYYRISSLGRLGSLPRKGTQTSAFRIRKTGSNKKGMKGGYQTTSLCRNAKLKTVYIHRLVAEHFLPNPDKLPVVNHLDGDPSNNRASNLQWCSYSQNMRHAFATNLRPSKLTDDNVRAIRSLKGSGRSQRTIASEFGVNQATISLVLSGKRKEYVSN